MLTETAGARESPAVGRLRARLAEAEARLRTVREEVQHLQEELNQVRGSRPPLGLSGSGPRGILGRSSALRATLNQAAQVAATGSTVLLVGETGTGKELIASAIHELSSRAPRPMVKVNCAAIPATLLESELFGRERGAYTGAFARQIGSFELAQHSTIFLDEVAELPLEMQAKLLRVLQDMKLQRLGSPRTVALDVRVIAASNRDLGRLTAQGRFRPDLFYRLSVFPIRVPPLRERREDIPVLVAAFVQEFAQALGKEVGALAPATLQALEGYAWPGNVRELRNVLERAVILAQGADLAVELPRGEPVPGGGTRI